MLQLLLLNSARTSATSFCVRGRACMCACMCVCVGGGNRVFGSDFKGSRAFLMRVVYQFNLEPWLDRPPTAFAGPRSPPRVRVPRGRTLCLEGPRMSPSQEEVYKHTETLPNPSKIGSEGELSSQCITIRITTTVYNLRTFSQESIISTTASM